MLRAQLDIRGSELLRVRWRSSEWQRANIARVRICFLRPQFTSDKVIAHPGCCLTCLLRASPLRTIASDDYKGLLYQAIHVAAAYRSRQLLTRIGSP